MTLFPAVPTNFLSSKVRRQRRKSIGSRKKRKKHFIYNNFLLVQINCSQTGNSSFYIYRTFPVDIVDVNEAPYDLEIVNGTHVQENEPAHTPVGTLFASDPDTKDVSIFLG